jgi:hypothetical protein
MSERYEAAKQAEIEAARRRVQAMEAVNSAARLLLEAENALLLVTKEHAQAMEQARAAAAALASEISADNDVMRTALAFPTPGGVQ